MSMKRVLTASAVTAALVASSAAMALPKVDDAIPTYKGTSGVSGNLSSVGSDTLANLMTLWAEAFKREYPNVNIQIQAAGSSTAPPALTEGTSNLGPMSRMMKSKEKAAFQDKHGYEATPIAVAIDALAVFVHKDNPVEGLDIKDIDAIFSSTRKCGGEKDAKTWGDVGVTAGGFGSKDIQLFGRNSVSGTYGYFKSKALCKGDYKNAVNEQPGSASVVQSVSTSLNAIGYSGIGYKTSGVKAIALSKKGSGFIEATPEMAVAGKYPLSRFLYVYV
ncbi:MAG: phosphate ABC transporter substrate-binding protein PstS family protein, partial [Gammaproteobacteria bacterium]